MRSFFSNLVFLGVCVAGIPAGAAAADRGDTSQARADLHHLMMRVEPKPAFAIRPTISFVHSWVPTATRGPICWCIASRTL